MGGLAMYIGVAAAVLLASQLPALTRGFVYSTGMPAVVVAGGLIMAIGLIDDRWGLDALTKFAGQITAASVLVTMGVAWSVLYIPFGGVGTIVLDQVSKQLGQTIVIENRAGGGTTIGVTAVARAAPDGHTILVHSSSFSASYSLHKSLPYDTFKDFAAVVPLGYQPTVLVVATGKPWKTLAELVAAAKAKPGALNFASAGVGAASHLAAERFRRRIAALTKANSKRGSKGPRFFIRP